MPEYTKIMLRHLYLIPDHLNSLTNSIFSILGRGRNPAYSNISHLRSSGTPLTARSPSRRTHGDPHTHAAPTGIQTHAHATLTGIHTLTPHLRGSTHSRHTYGDPHAHSARTATIAVSLRNCAKLHLRLGATWGLCIRNSSVG